VQRCEERGSFCVPYFDFFEGWDDGERSRGSGMFWVGGVGDDVPVGRDDDAEGGRRDVAQVTFDHLFSLDEESFDELKNQLSIPAQPAVDRHVIA